jgi:D-glycero-alpha-D-manno-heptose-7-phosphate kinase
LGIKLSITRRPKVVSTITPQRISFIGGGTDLPSFYEEYGGGVISSAIDRYIYVTVKRHSPLFQEAYRLSYSVTEHSNSIDEIKNDIARECLKLIEVEPPLYIATAADLPASSGLGSSSSFAVGLLNALHLFKGERVSAAQLAEEACHIEIEVLKNPIGKQDQYAVAFGGLNHFIFNKNGRVEIDHLVMQNNLIQTLFDNCLLVWSGIQRDASSVLSKQKENLSSKIDAYKILLQSNLSFKELFLNPTNNFLQDFGALLESSWGIKKSLEESISSSVIDEVHSQIIRSGGCGGKLSGAGGGGFLFEVVPKEMQKSIFDLYGEARVINVNFEPNGSRILHEIY